MNTLTNLAYRYNVTHYPLFAVVKALVNNNDASRALTLDVGIGPNFMTANGFTETSLDDMTIVDEIFSSHTATTFAATIGAGVRLNHFFGQTPLECGYRFYYLGQGHFNKLTDQVLNTLNTGSDYANALMCAVIF